MPCVYTNPVEFGYVDAERIIGIGVRPNVTFGDGCVWNQFEKETGVRRMEYDRFQYLFVVTVWLQAVGI